MDNTFFQLLCLIFNHHQNPSHLPDAKYKCGMTQTKLGTRYLKVLKSCHCFCLHRL